MFYNFGHRCNRGILCDDTCRAIVAFSTNMEKCSIMRAKIRGPLFGLHIAWELGV
ncbi:hypothetical protein LINGRAHAP2_LOCUS3889 [Linum grandiflorum]